MIKKIAIYSIFSVILFSCTYYNSFLDKEKGLTKADLITKWGATKSIKIDDTKEVLTYENQYGQNEIGYTYNNEDINANMFEYCLTNFLIDNNKVTKWSYNGKKCSIYDILENDELKSEINLNKSQIISKWGMPKYTAKVDNTTEVLTFYHNTDSNLFSYKEAPSDDYLELSSKKVNYVFLYECFTNFTLINNKVVKYSQRGNKRFCKKLNKAILNKKK